MYQWLHKWLLKKNDMARSIENHLCIITGYFIDAVTENNRCPLKVQLDHGIENTHYYYFTIML